MKRTISLKRIALPVAGIAMLSVLASPIVYAQGATPPNQQQNSSIVSDINLSHLNSLEAHVTYPSNSMAGLSTFNPGSPLAVWWTYANYNSQSKEYTPVGSGKFDSSTNTWGQGESALDDISRAVVVYLRHYEMFHDALSLQKAESGLRTICYLQATSGPDAGNFFDWIQPTGQPNLTVSSDSHFSWWGSRALWALTEGYGVLKTSDPTLASYLQNRIKLAMQAVARRVQPDYGQFSSVDGFQTPNWLIGDGSDASSVAVLGLLQYYQLTGSTTAKSLAQMLATGIYDLRAGSGTVWPYGGFLDYAQSFSMWHGYGSNQIEALVDAGHLLNNPTWISAAQNAASGFLVHTSLAYGPIAGLDPGPADQTEIAYAATSMFQDYLALSKVTHSQRYMAMAGVSLGWYFGANRAGYDMYNSQTGATFDGINDNGTLNTNSGAESTIEGLMALEDAAKVPGLQSYIPQAPPISENLPITVPASNGLISGGQVVTPASAWTGQGQLTNGSYVSLQPNGQDVLNALVSNPGMDKIQIETSPGSSPQLLNVSIAGMNSSLQTPAIPGASIASPVYLTLQSAPGVVPVYQGLTRIHLSLAPGATQAADIDSVVLQPVVEYATWNSGDQGELLTVVKNMSGHTVTWTDPWGQANIVSSPSAGESVQADATGSRIMTVSIPAYGFIVVVSRR